MAQATILVKGGCIFVPKEGGGGVRRAKTGEAVEIDEAALATLIPGTFEVVKPGKQPAPKGAKHKGGKKMQMVTQVENGGKPATTNRHAILRKAAESVTGAVTPSAVNAKLPEGTDPYTAAEIKRLGF